MLDRRDFFRKTAVLAAAARCLPAQEDPFSSLPASVWRNARQNGLIMIHRPAPEILAARTQIARADEPGDPLIVQGQVFAPDGGSPAANVTVYAYNTDARGYYGEKGAEYPPRIYGWMKTGGDGCFELRTVRPGNYPNMQVPAHIHFSLWGGGYPPQWTDDLKFEGDRFLTQDAIAKDAELGDFRTIHALRRGGDHLLRCGIRIRLGRATNFH